VLKYVFPFLSFFFHAKTVTELVAQGKFEEANFERYKEPLDDVQELYLERFLDSKTRSAIRKHNQTKG